MPSDVVDVTSNISLYVAGICHTTTCMRWLRLFSFPCDSMPSDCMRADFTVLRMEKLSNREGA